MPKENGCCQGQAHIHKCWHTSENPDYTTWKLARVDSQAFTTWAVREKRVHLLIRCTTHLRELFHSTTERSTSEITFNGCLCQNHAIAYPSDVQKNQDVEALTLQVSQYWDCSRQERGLSRNVTNFQAINHLKLPRDFSVECHFVLQGSIAWSKVLLTYEVRELWAINNSVVRW